ncbi:DUF6152 family protein [Candidatus Rariloculus sp.]|uniref:DUF6152 family protein n=1 Tax=Candidatus Rariloculus sp. TaxID=3101265 RepID=UPI003D0E9EC4
MHMSHTYAIQLAALLAFLGMGTAIPRLLSAHHGTSVSYDSQGEWSAEVIVRSFDFINPHPTMTFDVIDELGRAEHWVAELNTNPARMLRAGWTKAETLKVMQPGNRVVVSVRPARTGSNAGLVVEIRTLEGREVAQR